MTDIAARKNRGIKEYSPDLQNPNNMLPDEVADFFTQLTYREAEAERQAAQEVRELSRRDGDGLTARREVLEAAAREFGVSSSTIDKLFRSEDRYSWAKRERPRQIFTEHIARPGWPWFPPDTELPDVLNPPLNHEFWFSNNTPITVPTMVQGPVNGWYQFLGWARSPDNDMNGLKFGFNSIFVLQPERIPSSSTGRWLSAPVMQFRGGFSGRAANNAGTDDSVVLYMELYQELYQAAGNDMVTLGTAQNSVAEQKLVHVEADDTTAYHLMRTPQVWPPIVFNGIHMNHPLYARLSLWFRCLAKGGDSGVTTDLFGVAGLSPVRVHTAQWPLLPSI